jgi:glutamate-ammonia-ligase adenylyltransferase
LNPDIQRSLDMLPEAFREHVRSNWQAFCESNSNALNLDVRVTETLPSVWMASEFVSQKCIRNPQMFIELARHDLFDAYKAEHYFEELKDRLKQISDEAQLQDELRQYRHREMLRIIWRDISGWADLNETIGDLSHLAEACIDTALTKLYTWHCEQYGTPLDSNGEPVQLVVLGMGKLGAWELNLSSDIDLIFSYAVEGKISSGSKELSHSEFFIRLAKKLIQALDNQTVDGFVFRVDMRLRPFGESGPLVSSFNAMELYYQTHGREWERYAMIKARVVAGDRKAGDELMAMLRPFVYRRYIDFGAYESLRDMKAMIAREVKRKGVEHNVKLGAGGIREIEFIGQVFQLIRGGRDSRLTARKIQKVLRYLGEAGYLPEYVVKELIEAYIFLRNVEHRLQAWADQQTHLLPEDDSARLRLAFSLGYESWSQFSSELKLHRNRVQGHFDQVFEAPQADLDESNSPGLNDLWGDSVDESASLLQLKELGYTDTQAVFRKIKALHNSRTYKSLSTTGQKRLDQLMPLLIGAVSQTNVQDNTIIRLLDLITSISKRSVYLSLLVENPIALSQLVKLADASPWICHYLEQHPLLLDDLLDPRTLYAPPDKLEMQMDLKKRLRFLGKEDEERAMDELRHFKHSNVLRVAAADIVEALPLMKVSDHLSWIAECILEETLELSWAHLIARHGRPPCSTELNTCDKGFAVIGYGKLGGRELGYGSDLDLVFLYEQTSQNEVTDGAAPISVPVFYARLGQRMIHILSAFTSAGSLYEIDMRLRPDGASGMLVSNLKAFGTYQKNKAWLWEHQALIRARMVAGDPVVGNAFNDIRRDVLSQQNNAKDLKLGIIEMRNKMRDSLDKSCQGEFDVKQGQGGLVDIEFLVQYFVLAHANEYPELLDFTDNINIITNLVKVAILSVDEGKILSETYQLLRNTTHYQSLSETKGNVEEEFLQTARNEITCHWQKNLETNLV